MASELLSRDKIVETLLKSQMGQSQYLVCLYWNNITHLIFQKGRRSINKDTFTQSTDGEAEEPSG